MPEVFLVGQNTAAPLTLYSWKLNLKVTSAFLAAVALPYHIGKRVYFTIEEFFFFFLRTSHCYLILDLQNVRNNTTRIYFNSKQSQCFLKLLKNPIFMLSLPDVS